MLFLVFGNIGEAKLFVDKSVKKPIPVKVEKIAQPAAAKIEVEDKITSDDLRATLVHIQELVKAQQEELAKAHLQNMITTNELNMTLDQSDKLQKEINVVTDDRNLQVQLKNKALSEVVKQSLVIDKQNKEIRKLKTVIAGEAALILAFLLLWLGVPKFSFPYGLIGSGVAVISLFGIVYFWL